MKPKLYHASDKLIAAVHAERMAGHKQKDMAEKFGIHQVSLSRWLKRKERIHHDDPGLQKLAEHLGLEVCDCLQNATQNELGKLIGTVREAIRLLTADHMPWDYNTARAVNLLQAAVGKTGKEKNDTITPTKPDTER